MEKPTGSKKEGKVSTPTTPCHDDEKERIKTGR
jgi:hypothetical protein